LSAVGIFNCRYTYWDKEKKQGRNKQVCIGKIDPLSGEIVRKRLMKR